MNKIGGGSFPGPASNGSEDIVPITDYHVLVQEGKDQHNCVASYMERSVELAEIYIYKVLAPERCTLAIGTRRWKWAILDLKGRYNRITSEETRRSVEEWFLHARACKKERLRLQKSASTYL